MNYLILCSIALLLILCSYLQFLWAKQRRHCLALLPLLFLILTFAFGLCSLLFAFVLIFIAELASSDKPRPTHRCDDC